MALEFALRLPSICLTVHAIFDLKVYPLLESVAAKITAPISFNIQHQVSLNFELSKTTILALLEPLQILLANLGDFEPHVIRIWKYTWSCPYERRGLVKLSCRAFNQPHEFVIFTDSDIDNLISAWNYKIPTANWPLRIPGKLIVGTKSITHNILRTLAPGDVILRIINPLLGETIFDPKRTIIDYVHPLKTLIAWGTPGCTRLCAKAELRNSFQIIVKEPWMPERHDLNNRDADAQKAVEELELPVHFEIGIATLPLSQLVSILPGYVIELDQPLQDPQVNLVVHGQTIGCGELIKVGQHFGIRIVRMTNGYDSN